MFVRAAELSSLARAARELTLSGPAVSRMIPCTRGRAWRDSFECTTRSLSFTYAGALYLERTR
ncbi:hypothetical protein GCM10011404_34170 [Sphingomonas prati]|nr:hypothetical protein GCM10011404_34170 [Sphingomonas prati]